MLKWINTFIAKYYNSGSKRTIKVKKNILISLASNFVGLIVGLLYVPLLIDYLGVEEYGIWLTIGSILTWFTFFDLGLGFGLRNKFAEAIASNDIQIAKEYLSTSYAVLLMVSAGIFLALLFINPFLNWSELLNAPIELEEKLSYLAIIIFFFFSLRFVFNLIGQVLSATLMPSINNMFGPIGNVLSLTIIYILTLTSTEGSILKVGSILSAIPVFVLFIASVVLYRTRYSDYKPSIKFVRFKHLNQLFGLGGKFFIIQISGIVIYQSTYMLISHVSTPEDVVVYGVALKYFAITTMLFKMSLQPLWSATTEAFHLKDFIWIKNSMQNLQKIGLIFTVVIIIALLISNFVYNLWLKDRVNIPFMVSFLVAVKSIIYVLFAPYVSFLNGVSKIQLNMRLVIVANRILYPIGSFSWELAWVGFGRSINCSNFNRAAAKSYTTNAVLQNNKQ